MCVCVQIYLNPGNPTWQSIEDLPGGYTVYINFSSTTLEVKNMHLNDKISPCSVIRYLGKKNIYTWKA